MTFRIIKRLLLFLFVSLLAVFFHHTITPRMGFIHLSHDTFGLQDYAYHIILTEHLLVKRQVNIYDPDTQMKVLSSYMNSAINVAMPVGATPVAFFLWIPFAIISHYQLSLSYTVWMMVSFLILAVSLWKIFRWQFSSGEPQYAPLLFIFLSFFSVVGFVTIILGQTSILAAGLISLLIYYLHNNRTSDDYKQRVLISVLAVFVALKPNYMIIGFGLLLIYKKGWEFILALGILLLLLLAMTPLLTIDWPGSYLKSVQMYLSGNFPAFYGWSVASETMSTFAGTFGSTFGRRNANCISLFILVLSWLWIAWSILRFSVPGLSGFTLNQLQCLILLIAGCLLFSTHSGAYEDLLLTPVFVAVGLSGRAPRLKSRGSIFICFCLVFIMSFYVFSQTEWNGLIFVLKTVVLVLMMVFAGGNDRPTYQENADPS